MGVGYILIMNNATQTASTESALWTTRPSFGVAGGPAVIVLTDEGSARAFSVGAKVRRGPACAALEALWAEGGSGYTSMRVGSRHTLRPLGKFDQLAWGYLRDLGYVESTHDDLGDGVRLTEKGNLAYRAGEAERVYLLSRCTAAASAA